jgi:hypothetical protein
MSAHLFPMQATQKVFENTLRFTELILRVPVAMRSSTASD